MGRFLASLFMLFALLSVGCDSSKSIFGCSNNKDRNIDLKLGQPGKTEVKNNLPENDNVQVLDADEKIEFTTDAGAARITHHVDRNIEVGDVIIANPDQQYLVKVKEVIQREDGSTQVILKQSRIEELVGDGTGSLSVENTPVYDIQDINRLNRLAQTDKNKETIYQVDENGKIVIRNLELFSVDLNSNGNITKGVNKILGIPIRDPYEKLSVSATAGGKYKAIVNEAVIEVIPTLRSNADWKSGKISEMETRLDTKVRYKVDISYIADGHIQMEALLDQFMPKKVIPIRVPGTPPIYLDIEMGIPAGVSFKAQQKGKTRVIFESEYEFYSVLHYDSETGIQTQKDQKVIINDKKIESSSSSTVVEAELFLKPQVTARFYRVVGPYVYLKPYIRGEIEWPSVKKKDDLYIGVTGGVGFEVSEPILLSNIVSFDSGKLFDFYTSFDLDGGGSGGPDVLALNANLRPNIVIDRIGPEGFVVLNLKEHREGEFLRYELIDSTDNGLLIPSETFYMDGQLFYYPLKDVKNDTFKVKIFGSDGKEEEVTVVVGVTPEVLAEVSQDRFGITTNSYKVSMGTPGEFKNNVPHHNLVAQATMALPTSECVRYLGEVSPEQLELIERYVNLSCDAAVPIMSEYRDLIAQARMNTGNSEATAHQRNEIMGELLTKVEDVKSTGNNINFEFYNLSNLFEFIMFKQSKSLDCYPQIDVSTIDEDHHIGLRFAIKDCENMEFQYQLNTEMLNYTFHNKLKWDISSAVVNSSGKTIEVRVSKVNLRKYELNQGSLPFYFIFPMAEHMKSILISSQRTMYYNEGSYGYGFDLPELSPKTFGFIFSFERNYDESAGRDKYSMALKVDNRRAAESGFIYAPTSDTIYQ